MEAVIANILQQLGFDSMTKAAEASFVEAVDKCKSCRTEKIKILYF